MFVSLGSFLYSHQVGPSLWKAGSAFNGEDDGPKPRLMAPEDILPVQRSKGSYRNADPINILLLPRAMRDLDLHKISSILIELRPDQQSVAMERLRRKAERVHDEIHIEQIVEEPAFFDKRIAQDVSETDGVDIGRVCEAIDGAQLYRGRNQS